MNHVNEILSLYASPITVIKKGEHRVRINFDLYDHSS